MRSCTPRAASAAILILAFCLVGGLGASRAASGDVTRFPVSLAQAITIAEATSHANAVEARLATQGGTPHYDVDTFANGVCWRGKIDARTGRLVGTPETEPAARLDRAERLRLRWLHDTASVPLRRAVEIAEQRSGGVAIASSVTSTDGKLAYDTEVAKGERVETLRIDPQSGRLLGGRSLPRRGDEGGSA
ncbi:MAG TPA: PepSY domain-containing protein [Stellaceae bacterium]|jgi:uncharacterized membrane protein YkoI|nr:PepSY domain-containing protein [Stellaceae bacterium]